MIKNKTTPEDRFIEYYNKIKKVDFNDKSLIKKYVINPNLKEYEKLHNYLKTIDWENDKVICDALDKSSDMIEIINYQWIMQLIKLEQVENYEDAKILYDIIYQTYYLISSQMYQNFDPEIEPEQIKNNIMDGAQHMRQALKTIEK